MIRVISHRSDSRKQRKWMGVSMVTLLLAWPVHSTGGQAHDQREYDWKKKSECFGKGLGLRVIWRPAGH